MGNSANSSNLVEWRRAHHAAYRPTPNMALILSSFPHHESRTRQAESEGLKRHSQQSRREARRALLKHSAKPWLFCKWLEKHVRLFPIAIAAVSRVFKCFASLFKCTWEDKHCAHRENKIERLTTPSTLPKTQSNLTEKVAQRCPRLIPT
jgi:hypothetical protein